MKTFDIEIFEKNKQNGNEYFFTKDDGTVVKQYGGEEYYETVMPKDSLFEMYYEYYNNGKLKKILKSFPNDFEIGVMKEYDEQGNLIKEEDLDKPFTYSWEDVKKYLKEHNVEDIKKDVINISRWSDNEETTWTLEFNGKYNDIKGRFVITLEGKTGEELLVKQFMGKKALGESGTIADYKILLKKNK